MSNLTLDPTQLITVSAKRLPEAQRPYYYNASLSQKVQITPDFEAFLILQGHANNKKATDWLQKANGFAIHDSDRDALLAAYMDNELEDATAAANEVEPIMSQFADFRSSYIVAGFEGVTEVGLFLDDLQRPMSEILVLGDRQRHRQQYALLSKKILTNKGLAQAQLKELNSWFDPLTAY